MTESAKILNPKATKSPVQTTAKILVLKAGKSQPVGGGHLHCTDAQDPCIDEEMRCKDVSADADSPVLSDQLLQDLESLPEAKLKQKYKLEFNSWRGAKSRSKQQNVPFDFPTFKGLLSHLGLKPHSDYQFDKVVPGNGYVPGNVRWASPKANSTNRDTTVFLTLDGETASIAEWAESTGQKAGTLYSRQKRGWSPEQIIRGKGPSTDQSPKQHLWDLTPWPSKHKEWERRYRSEYPDLYDRGRPSRYEYYMNTAKADLNKLQGKAKALYPFYAENVPLLYCEDTVLKPESEAQIRRCEAEYEKILSEIRGIQREMEMVRTRYDPEFDHLPPSIDQKLWALAFHDPNLSTGF